MIYILILSAKCVNLQIIPNFATCRARNPDDIMELQEDMNKLVEWAKKWQISFMVGKCSVMHIRHNNMHSNYNMSNQQLPTTDQQRDLGIIITKDLKWQK